METIKRGGPPEIRFFRFVNKTDRCWLWTGFVRKDRNKGYGFFQVGGKAVFAHRFSYELVNGKIPDGLELDHLCRNTACVRPDHLEAVTHLENVRRARKDFCKRGHSFAEHSYLYTNKNGYAVRRCRPCNLMLTKLSVAKRKAASN